MAASSPSPPKKGEVQLDPSLQARLLEQMRKDQASRIRKRKIVNWVLIPLGLLSLAVGVKLSFAKDHVTAMMANLFTSSVVWYLWKVNKKRKGRDG
ncbi:MAG: hypothetical protein KC416_01125 [Myxococcales bacterium]|nr:hypothetical protein [Myxococcales bacterium]